jgi:hypothetical protein
MFVENNNISAESVITEYRINTNYPNSFNASTVISWQFPFPNQVKVQAYDVLGNEIATLVDEKKEAGSYDVVHSAANLPSEVYFYEVQTASLVETKKRYSFAKFES